MSRVRPPSVTQNANNKSTNQKAKKKEGVQRRKGAPPKATVKGSRGASLYKKTKEAKFRIEEGGEGPNVKSKASRRIHNGRGAQLTRAFRGASKVGTSARFTGGKI